MSDSRTSLPPGWGRKRFTEMADVTFSGVDKKSMPGETPVHLCNYVDVFHNHRLHCGIEFMAATATEREVANFRLRQGDVVFTKDSETPEEIAEPAYVAEDLNGVVCGYHLAIARPKGDVDGAFLYYAMKETGVRRQFARSANGVTRFGLTLDALDQIAIPIPPLNEQRRIAEILSTWDETLERLSRQIEQKETVFITLRGSLTTGQRRLRGWNNTWTPRPLSAFLEPVKRAVPKPSKPYQALSIRSHGKGTFQRFVDRPEAVDMDTLYRVGGRDLIVNITFAWEGAVALANPEDEGCLVSHRFPTFVINEEVVDRDFLGYVLNSKRFFYKLGVVSPGGAGRNRVLNQRDFLKIEISLPPLGEQHAVAKLLLDTEREIAALKAERAALTKQRDTLATELLTGRIRVPLAEAAS